MNLICRLLGHKPYIEDTPETSRPADGYVVGPIRRFCGRCGITLDGDIPRVGDRFR